ncbi:TonB family C-terminal domain-containing protein [Alkalispirochaeta americana]|uniref:TonB family C-terminal domain-containing protein n=1 Tax=Alkalispirochaeta americana TaxID=159291 RepID=A0A1N6Q6L5_9SPIO|nr:TonB family C-terminal domain-containing protein [Alkalispirochaeta americana]
MLFSLVVHGLVLAGLSGYSRGDQSAPGEAREISLAMGSWPEERERIPAPGGDLPERVAKEPDRMLPEPESLKPETRDSEEKPDREEPYDQEADVSRDREEEPLGNTEEASESEGAGESAGSIEPEETDGVPGEASRNIPDQRGPEPSREDLLERYIGQVRTGIEKARQYPLVARRREQEGTVVVRFSLSSAGTIVEGPDIHSPSRYPALNRAALEAVTRAAPFAEFSEGFLREIITFVVPIHFRLEI